MSPRASNRSRRRFCFGNVPRVLCEASPLTLSAAAPLRKRSRSDFLFGCKRPHDENLSLPTFCGFPLLAASDPACFGCSVASALATPPLRYQSLAGLPSPLRLLSAKGPARIFCSVVNALTTKISRYQPFAGFRTYGAVQFEEKIRREAGFCTLQPFIRLRLPCLRRR